MLYNSQSSSQIWPLTLDFSLLPIVKIYITTMATLLKDHILYFFGQNINEKEAQKNLAKCIENLNFAVEG